MENHTSAGERFRPLSAFTTGLGDRVFHEKFGYGEVMGREGNKLEIAFDTAVTKRVIDGFVSLA